MVRIFLEKYLPNRVIATTFTRAAAAELKSRIRLRLVEIQQYLEPLRSVLETDIHMQAEQETDPLKQHVLKTLRHVSLPHLTTTAKLVIDQLDGLFVGTLDSCRSCCASLPLKVARLNVPKSLRMPRAIPAN